MGSELGPEAVSLHWNIKLPPSPGTELWSVTFRFLFPSQHSLGYQALRSDWGGQGCAKGCEEKKKNRKPPPI